MFNVKDSVAFDLRSRVVYKFLCAGSCNSNYIGETSRHLKALVREHLGRGRNSRIFQHLQQSETCRILRSKKCFTILDSVPKRVQFSLKEVAHKRWEKPALN